MKWSDITPGDMILISGTPPTQNWIDPESLKLFKHDVFMIVGIQKDTSLDDQVDVQMLSCGSRTTTTRKHRMYQAEVSSVFTVFRNGEEITT